MIAGGKAGGPQSPAISPECHMQLDTAHCLLIYTHLVISGTKLLVSTFYHYTQPQSHIERCDLAS